MWGSSRSSRGDDISSTYRRKITTDGSESNGSVTSSRRSKRTRDDDGQERSNRPEGANDESPTQDSDRRRRQRKPEDERNKRKLEKSSDKGSEQVFQDYGDTRRSNGSDRKLSRNAKSGAPKGASRAPEDVDPNADLSSHVPNQFPHQAPLNFSAPYRPPSAQQDITSTTKLTAQNNQVPGLAADYYGDQGESVMYQPGVRPRTPIVTGTEPHLMAALPVSAPPAETGSGAAAEFYSGANFGAQGTTGPSATQISPPGPAPSAAGDPGRPSRPGAMSKVAGSAAIAAGAAGAAALGYEAMHHSSQHNPSSQNGGDYHHSSRLSSFTQAASHQQDIEVEDTQYSSNSQPNTAAYAAGPGALSTVSGRPSRPLRQGSGVSSQPTLAYLQHHQEHEHRGPFRRFLDWWRDYEDVRKMEAYTEYIGVCRYCFDSGTTVWDAPRQHTARKRKSREFQNRTRVGKESRYISDTEGRRKSRASKIAPGLVGAGLATAAFDAARNTESELDDRDVRARRRKTSSFNDVDRGQNASRERRRSNRARYSSGNEISASEYVSRRDSTRSDRGVSSSKQRKGESVGAVTGAAIVASVSNLSSRPKRQQSLDFDASEIQRGESRSSPTYARRSSSSSDEKQSPGLFGGFFTKPRSNNRQSKSQKSTGFFNFANASSSSTDSHLFYGAPKPVDSNSKKSTKRDKGKNASGKNALLGLGTAAALLAAAEAGQGSGPRRAADLIAVREPKPSSAIYKPSDHPMHRDRKDHEWTDDGWESATEADDASSIDSALAFGDHHLNYRRSTESLVSDASGTDKWGWRWGNKKTRRHSNSRPEDPILPVTAQDLTHPLPDIGPVFRDERVSISESLQEVFPEPTSDPYNYDAGKRTYEPAYGQKDIVRSRVENIPLRQPQPVSQVNPPVYAAKDAPLNMEMTSQVPPVPPSESVSPFTVGDLPRRTSSPDVYDPRSMESSSRRIEHWSSAPATDEMTSAYGSRRISAPKVSTVVEVAAIAGGSAVIASKIASSLKKRSNTVGGPSGVRFDLSHASSDKELPSYENRGGAENSRASKTVRRRSNGDRPFDGIRSEFSTTEHDNEELTATSQSASEAVTSQDNRGNTRYATEDRDVQHDERVVEVREAGRPLTHPIYDDDIFDPNFFKRNQKHTVTPSQPNRTASDVFAELEDKYAEEPKSMADFFAPPELSDHSAAISREERDVNSDDDVQRNIGQDAFGTRRYNSSKPWPIPRLNIIAPTPPVSMSGSVKSSRSPSPSNIEDRSADIEDTADPTSETSSKEVRWGEQPTNIYEEEPPKIAQDIVADDDVSAPGQLKSDQSIAVADFASMANENRGSDSYEGEISTDSYDGQPPVPVNIRESPRMPGGFEDDFNSTDFESEKPIETGSSGRSVQVDDTVQKAPPTELSDIVAGGVLSNGNARESETSVREVLENGDEISGKFGDSQDLDLDAGSRVTADSETATTTSSRSKRASKDKKRKKKSKRRSTDDPVVDAEGAAADGPSMREEEAVEADECDAGLEAGGSSELEKRYSADSGMISPDLQAGKQNPEPTPEDMLERRLSGSEDHPPARDREIMHQDTVQEPTQDPSPGTASAAQEGLDYPSAAHADASTTTIEPGIYESPKNESFEPDTFSTTREKLNEKFTAPLSEESDNPATLDNSRDALAGSYPVNVTMYPELIRLPDSRPGSPYDMNTTAAARQDLTPIRTPSSSAVPLRFRRPPPSPVFIKDSPVTSPSSTEATFTMSLPRPRSSRPNSTEFRPLYLVERNSKIQEPDEALPSLPLSRTPSQSSSLHEKGEDYRSALESPEPSSNPVFNPFDYLDPDQVPPNLIEQNDSANRSDYLDSQQTTPKAATFPSELSAVPDMATIDPVLSQMDQRESEVVRPHPNEKEDFGQNDDIARNNDNMTGVQSNAEDAERGIHDTHPLPTDAVSEPERGMLEDGSRSEFRHETAILSGAALGGVGAVAASQSISTIDASDSSQREPEASKEIDQNSENLEEERSENKTSWDTTSDKKKKKKKSKDKKADKKADKIAEKDSKKNRSSKVEELSNDLSSSTASLSRETGTEVEDAPWTTTSSSKKKARKGKKTRLVLPLETQDSPKDEVEVLPGEDVADVKQTGIETETTRNLTDQPLVQSPEIAQENTTTQDRGPSVFDFLENPDPMVLDSIVHGAAPESVPLPEDDSELTSISPSDDVVMTDAGQEVVREPPPLPEDVVQQWAERPIDVETYQGRESEIKHSKEAHASNEEPPNYPKTVAADDVDEENREPTTHFDAISYSTALAAATAATARLVQSRHASKTEISSPRLQPLSDNAGGSTELQEPQEPDESLEQVAERVPDVHNTTAATAASSEALSTFHQAHAVVEDRSPLVRDEEVLDQVDPQQKRLPGQWVDDDDNDDEPTQSEALSTEKLPTDEVVNLEPAHQLSRESGPPAGELARDISTGDGPRAETEAAEPAEPAEEFTWATPTKKKGKKDKRGKGLKLPLLIEEPDEGSSSPMDTEDVEPEASKGQTEIPDNDFWAPTPKTKGKKGKKGKVKKGLALQKASSATADIGRSFNDNLDRTLSTDTWTPEPEPQPIENEVDQQVITERPVPQPQETASDHEWDIAPEGKKNEKKNLNKAAYVSDDVETVGAEAPIGDTALEAEGPLLKRRNNENLTSTDRNTAFDEVPMIDRHQSVQDVIDASSMPEVNTPETADDAEYPPNEENSRSEEYDRLERTDHDYQNTVSQESVEEAEKGTIGPTADADFEQPEALHLAEPDADQATQTKSPSAALDDQQDNDDFDTTLATGLQETGFDPGLATIQSNSPSKEASGDGALDIDSGDIPFLSKKQKKWDERPRSREVTEDYDLIEAEDAAERGILPSQDTQPADRNDNDPSFDDIVTAGISGAGFDSQAVLDSADRSREASPNAMGVSPDQDTRGAMEDYDIEALSRRSTSPNQPSAAWRAGGSPHLGGSPTRSRGSSPEYDERQSVQSTSRRKYFLAEDNDVMASSSSPRAASPSSKEALVAGVVGLTGAGLAAAALTRRDSGSAKSAGEDQVPEQSNTVTGEEQLGIERGTEETVERPDQQQNNQATDLYDDTDVDNKDASHSHSHRVERPPIPRLSTADETLLEEGRLHDDYRSPSTPSRLEPGEVPSNRSPELGTPSPVESMTKDRASYLFNSPPDVKGQKDHGVEASTASPPLDDDFIRRSESLPSDAVDNDRTRDMPGATRTDVSLTEDALARLSWPPVDENEQTMEINRNLKRQTRRLSPAIEQDEDIPVVPAYISEGRARSSSVHSVVSDYRPAESVHSQSMASNRSASRAGTPTLRRVVRSVSGSFGGLASARRRSEAEASLVGAKSELSNTSNNNTLRRPPSYDPLKGTGKDRRQSDMSDGGAYEGWGDVRGSPRSPNRPPSIRKRQSVQILDLESRLDQITSDNRSLQDAHARAQQSLEDAGIQHDETHRGLTEAVQSRDLALQKKDVEINSIKASLEVLQQEVGRLNEHNQHLQASASRDLPEDADDSYAQLHEEHAYAREQWQQSSRELSDLKQRHGQLTAGMEGVVREEINNALEDKDAEIRSLRAELDRASQQIRTLQSQVARSDDGFLTLRNEDFFDSACQQLCQHVQQWVLRFSKFSDSLVCRKMSRIRDDKIETRFDNAILDGTDVDVYLANRVKRRDVFMSVAMSMIWEFVFTRYLFGMDRDQRQKLKGLEKILAEVGPAAAVAQWRATTLTLLSKRAVFAEQRAQDTEAIMHEIYDTLARILPPPNKLVMQVQESLRNVLNLAVDLSIEMRTQRAEYIMLPPLQPEYDSNGDLARKIYFSASLMNERSGETSSNEELERSQAVVRMVLFPLVVKKGDESGEGDDEIVVCPAQVLVARDGKERSVRKAKSGAISVKSGGAMSLDQRSVAPSTLDMSNAV